MLRFILYFLLFFILFRLLYTLLKNFFGNKSNKDIKSGPVKKKSKFEDVEEAKYIDITREDEKKN